MYVLESEVFSFYVFVNRISIQSKVLFRPINLFRGIVLARDVLNSAQCNFCFDKKECADAM